MNIESFYNPVFSILNSTTFWWLATGVFVAAITFFINRRGRTPYL